MSGLNWTVKSVAFKQGLDTRSQQKLVIDGKWAALNNLTLTKDNTPRLRDGVAPLVASNANSLATYNNELLAISGPTASSISTAGAATAVPLTGRVGNVFVSKQEIRRSNGTQDSLDCATGDGFTCYVWRDLTAAGVVNGVYLSIFDQTTGSRIIDATPMRSTTTVFGPRVAYSPLGGGAFFIFYIQGTSLYARVVLTSAPSVLGAETALITSTSLADISFDVCAFDSVFANVMVIYGWNDGTTSARSIGVNRVGTTPNAPFGPANLVTQAQQPVATISGMTCCAFSSTRAGAFIMASAGGTFGGGIIGTVIDNNWSIATAAARVDPFVQTTAGNTHITACTDGGGNLQVFWDYASEWATDAINPVRTQTLTPALATFLGPGIIVNSATFAGATGTARGPQGPFICGKAFLSGTHTYLPLCLQENYSGLVDGATGGTVNNNQQCTFFLYDVTGATTASGTVGDGTAAPVARALYGTFGVAGINANPPAVSTPCSVAITSAGVALMPCTERTLLSFNNGLNISATGICALSLTSNTTLAQSRAQLGQLTFIAGGDIVMYDGSGITEASFPVFPEGVGVLVVVGGGAMTAGQHQLCAVYEWIDGAGERHQSAPSPAVTFTVAANGRITVQVPTLLVSMKSVFGLNAQPTTVTAVLYMTAAGGVTFNRITSIFSPTLNDPTTNKVTFTNLNPGADTAFAANEVLYSQPSNPGTSTLPNNGPAPATMVMVHQNRLWFDKADQPLAYGYSQQSVQGLGLQFNETLGGQLPADTGPLVGMASMDDKAILFTALKPYAVFGSGPTPNGANGSYSDPTGIASDVGCSSRASILSMPQGIIFKSPKGWYLLGRDLTVRYIGEGVAAFDARVVTSATLLGDRQECRFTTTTGLTLVFSYNVDGTYQWSTFTCNPQTGETDALFWSTSGTFVRSFAALGLATDVSGSTVDSFSGASNGIAWTARTGFMKLALEGYQRVKRLYLTMSASASPTISLTIGTFLNDSYGGPLATAKTIDLSTITFPTVSAVDLGYDLPNQKCKSVAFTFAGNAAASSTLVPVIGIQALALEIGMKRGTNKLPSAQSV